MSCESGSALVYDDSLNTFQEFILQQTNRQLTTSLESTHTEGVIHSRLLCAHHLFKEGDPQKSDVEVH